MIHAIEVAVADVRYVNTGREQKFWHLRDV